MRSVIGQLDTMLGDEEIKQEMTRQRKQQLNELGIHFVLGALSQRAEQNASTSLQRNPLVRYELMILLVWCL